MKVSQVRIDKLIPHPRNYRSHPEDQLAHIAASIEANGFYRNVVLAADGATILAGHGVVEAARRLGRKAVPAVTTEFAADDPKALKILAGDNEISKLGEIDDRMLTDMLREIQQTDYGLLGTGFDEMSLAALLMVTRPAAEIADFDAASEWAGMPDYEDAKKAVFVKVAFRSKEDRAAFMQEKLGLSEGDARSYGDGSIYSTWYPPMEDDDLASLGWVKGRG